MKCTATATTTGEPCGNWAMRGATVCRKHGGAAPQVRRAAEVRAARMEAHATAERMIARAGVDADPIEHLLDSLYRAAALVQVWGTMVAALDARGDDERGTLSYYEADPEDRDELRVVSSEPLVALDRHGMAQIHPFVSEYNQWVERRAKFAKLCIDAGIAEAQIRIQQQQVEIVQRAFEATLDEMNLSGDRRQEARRTYARHLRLVA